MLSHFTATRESDFHSPTFTALTSFYYNLIDTLYMYYIPYIVNIIYIVSYIRCCVV